MIINSIQQLLRGRSLVRVAPDDTVRAACAVFEREDVGAAAVMDGHRLVGILSERDVIRRCICAGRPTAETRVSEVMTADPVTIPLQASLATAQTAMIEGHFRHLPVVTSDGEVVGMLSFRDIPTEYRLMVERYRDYRGAPDAAPA
ncbi:Arabinose 5-phosphate isomerase KdsD [Roseivivax jejudonensis]|uniref:Arabinose 5-phosphate isomerase KdsD n=1 Tax=Roseivivax jejudonensis TaxID=1529041 RepID=A0A1X7A759_9RHOB|nr:CBS domain-containing protein [Roseivivax jejudonensis]SLN72224.1 Arabinose 5-phosphate isomerase KdsD [Roseivivax jejudonensis]